MLLLLGACSHAGYVRSDSAAIAAAIYKLREPLLIDRFYDDAPGGSLEAESELKDGTFELRSELDCDRPKR